jgi:serine/threonine protein phosphatase 1
MATIAVGDIHGNLQALVDVLGQLRREVQPDDTVVFVGDYIDRGPDSKGCIDAILRFRSEIDADVVTLMGNHEDWFLQTLRDHSRHSRLLAMEAFETIRSYSPDAVTVLRKAIARDVAAVYSERVPLPYEAFFECVPAEHIEFFENLRLYHQTVDCVCTHGGVNPRVDGVHQQLRRDLIWGSGTFPDGYDGAEIVVYGHRNNATLDDDAWPMPTVVGQTIGIDTISHGVLTAIRLPDRHLVQSARFGLGIS